MPNNYKNIINVRNIQSFTLYQFYYLLTHRKIDMVYAINFNLKFLTEICHKIIEAYEAKCLYKQHILPFLMQNMPDDMSLMQHSVKLANQSFSILNNLLKDLHAKNAISAAEITQFYLKVDHKNNKSIFGRSWAQPDNHILLLDLLLVISKNNANTALNTKIVAELFLRQDFTLKTFRDASLSKKKLLNYYYLEFKKNIYLAPSKLPASKLWSETESIAPLAETKPEPIKTELTLLLPESKLDSTKANPPQSANISTILNDFSLFSVPVENTSLKMPVNSFYKPSLALPTRFKPLPAQQKPSPTKGFTLESLRKMNA